MARLRPPIAETDVVGKARVSLRSVAGPKSSTVRRSLAAAISLLASATLAQAQTGANVLVVINSTSTGSETIGREYAARRAVPQDNLCRIPMPKDETVSRPVYNAAIERPVWKCISTQQAHDRILYIVLTKDVPMRIAGTDGRTGTASSVDSELTLLYRRRTGQHSPVLGFVPNPYFAEAAPLESLKPFTHEAQDIYLVTRLDGHTVKDAVDLIGRSSAASPEGSFVLDGNGTAEPVPERWFSAAAQRLTSQGLGDRVSRDGLPTESQRLKVLGYVRVELAAGRPGAVAGGRVRAWSSGCLFRQDACITHGGSRQCRPDRRRDQCRGTVSRRHDQTGHSLFRIRQRSQPGRVVLCGHAIPQLADRSRRRSAVRPVSARAAAPGAGRPARRRGEQAAGVLRTYGCWQR